MKFSRMRLDRFVAKVTAFKRSDVRLLIAQKRLRVDGQLAPAADFSIDQFSTVSLDEQVVHCYQAQYFMLNKPAGVVSATSDDEHKTVIDLFRAQYSGGYGEYFSNAADDLHIAGRLDFNSTGLVLLTNDGAWSRALSAPASRVKKTYLVSLAKPLTEEYVQAFTNGMEFPFEGITTLPATLKILTDYTAEVGLYEGRYHQIKRMFGRFQNEVLSLARTHVGSVKLDAMLADGHSRALTLAELEALGVVHRARPIEPATR